MISLITFLPYWIALTVELLVSYNLHLALGLSIEIAVCRLLMIIKVSITVRNGFIENQGAPNLNQFSPGK